MAGQTLGILCRHTTVNSTSYNKDWIQQSWEIAPGLGVKNRGLGLSTICQVAAITFMVRNYGIMHYELHNEVLENLSWKYKYYNS